MASSIIDKALQLPGGARFYRCALQVNPFAYLKEHAKTTKYADEASYNEAIVKACKENNVEVVAITDHYRVATTKTLAKACLDAGIQAFPAFEAVTKDGVHVLCIFNLRNDYAYLERILGACGIHHDIGGSPIGNLDVTDLLEKAREWDAVFIAAHIDLERGGLLGKLSGQSRVRAWTSEHLLAVSIPGAVRDMPAATRSILENKDVAHRRDRTIAILNAQDVNSPEDLARPGATCMIKMSEVTKEGLRQAFLDPESRIRLNSDPVSEEHSEFVAMTWEAGFLDGSGIHFNENLNVLIGGRGTGKSTIVESIRYVLAMEPIGDEARLAHDGIIRQVLKSGTKISLLIRTYRPAKRQYLIERTIPNPSVVRDEAGKVLNLSPLDVISQCEVYGQHEISELAKSPEKRTRLLERFIDRDPKLAQRKMEIRRELEKSRIRIIDVKKELKQIEDRLASLPALEETLKTFQEAGLEDRLKEQSLYVREERLLKTIPQRINEYRLHFQNLRSALPIDRTFLSDKALSGLPNHSLFSKANKALEELSGELTKIVKMGEDALRLGMSTVEEIENQWRETKKAADATYQQILRDLQKNRIDGEEFIRLRRQIEELRPLKERQSLLERELSEHERHRINILAEWEDVKTAEFRQLQQAAKKVNGALTMRVTVQLTFAGNREPLIQLLKEQVGGRLSETIDALKKRPELSLRELADACKAGRDIVASKFNIPPSQAERICQAASQVVMLIEELDLTSTMAIKLNVAADDQTPVWQALEQLSTGQKATAVLLLLLLESDAPLVVDQPEDDLDNRFISDGVVPKMRQEKRRRQFVFATHNANIPVLGDAELILGLQAFGEAGEGKATIPVDHMGSMDKQPVRELVEEILE
ncbi:MAG: TrlF family AAA-like ATPase, partial [Nitrospira sp.]